MDIEIDNLGYPVTTSTDTKGNILVEGIILYETKGEVVDRNGNKVEITAPLLDKVVATFTKQTSGFMRKYPPMVVEHQLSADNTVGRVVPPMTITTVIVDGTERKAVKATILVAKEEAKRDVQAGVFKGLSSRVNLVTGKLGEVSFVADPAIEFCGVLSSPNKKLYVAEKVESLLHKKLDNLSTMLNNRLENRQKIMATVTHNCFSRYEADKMYEAVKDLPSNVVETVLLSLPKSANRFQTQNRSKNREALQLQHLMENPPKETNMDFAQAYEKLKKTNPEAAAQYNQLEIELSKAKEQIAELSAQKEKEAQANQAIQNNDAGVKDETQALLSKALADVEAYKQQVAELSKAQQQEVNATLSAQTQDDKQDDALLSAFKVIQDALLAKKGE